MKIPVYKLSELDEEEAFRYLKHKKHVEDMIKIYDKMVEKGKAHPNQIDSLKDRIEWAIHNIKLVIKGEVEITNHAVNRYYQRILKVLPSTNEIERSKIRNKILTSRVKNQIINKSNGIVEFDNNTILVVRSNSIVTIKYKKDETKKQQKTITKL